MALWRERATWGGKGSRARQKRADAKRRLEALEEVVNPSPLPAICRVIVKCQVLHNEIEVFALARPFTVLRAGGG